MVIICVKYDKVGTIRNLILKIKLYDFVCVCTMYRIV